VAPKWPANLLDRHSRQVAEARDVVAREPERVDVRRIEREQDGPLARHTAQLAQAACTIGPVVVGQHGHRRIEARVGERERICGALDRRRRVRRALRAHHR
jgi:hypothetical protein